MSTGTAGYDPFDVIARESLAFATAAVWNLDAQVPSCPDWQVRDLVQHLGVVQRFHTLHGTRGVTDPPTGRPEVHQGDAGMLEWFAEGTHLLLEALASLPHDAPAWNWAGRTPQVVGFWPRRMALEAAAHRWDCENACTDQAASARGATADVDGTDQAVAVDGIDEVLTVHLPADRADEPGTETGVVHVRLTDGDARWTIALGKDSAVQTEKTPDAVLEGTASEVFLALWGRVPLASLSVEGDAALVAALRTG